MPLTLITYNNYMEDIKIVIHALVCLMIITFHYKKCYFYTLFPAVVAHKGMKLKWNDESGDVKVKTASRLASAHLRLMAQALKNSVVKITTV